MKNVRPLPTRERLCELFSYDAESGVLSWRVVGQFRRNSTGCMTSQGYMSMYVDGRRYLVHRLIWKMITGNEPLDEIDHINGNRSDNRARNLRNATRAENARNVGVQRNNSTGLRGVINRAAYRKGRSFGDYDAYIQVNKKRYYLGSFKTPELAHQAYCEAAKKHHGEFARVA